MVVFARVAPGADRPHPPSVTSPTSIVNYIFEQKLKINEQLFNLPNILYSSNSCSQRLLVTSILCVAYLKSTHSVVSRMGLS